MPLFGGHGVAMHMKPVLSDPRVAAALCMESCGEWHVACKVMPLHGGSANWSACTAPFSRYVLCPGCKSVDTLLDKDSATRLMHLRCQQCGASRTVTAIKSGFLARVTKRPKS
jgi:hypothetical protein